MKYLKTCFITFIGIIICISVLSTLYYYKIINNNTFNVLKILLLIIIFNINGYKIERISNNKRNNIIVSFIISLVLLIINICFAKISYKLFIYLIIIISSNLLGSFMFIKRKKRS